MYGICIKTDSYCSVTHEAAAHVSVSQWKIWNHVSLSQTPGWTSTRPGWEMDPRLEQTPLTSGVDLEKELDQEMLLQWVNNVWRLCFIIIKRNAYRWNKRKKKHRSGSSLVAAVVCRNDNLNHHNEATLSFFLLGWGSSCCRRNDRDHDGQRSFQLMLFMWESRRTDSQSDVSPLRPVNTPVKARLIRQLVRQLCHWLIGVWHRWAIWFQTLWSAWPAGFRADHQLHQFLFL